MTSFQWGKRIGCGAGFVLVAGLALACSNGLFVSSPGGGGQSPPGGFDGAALNGAVYAISSDPDTGIVYVGGAFTTANGVEVNRVVVFKSDGSLHTDFNMGTGFDAPVRAIHVDALRKVLVGGEFTSYQGSSENGLVRLHTFGDKDAVFVTGSGLSGIAHAIDEIGGSAGRYIVGGQFSSYDGFGQAFLFSIQTDNGSRDPSFGPALNNTVRAVKYVSANVFTYGGDFTLPTVRIGMMDTVGADPSGGGVTGFDGAVRAISLDGEDPMVFGDFTDYAGSPAGGFAKIHGDLGTLQLAGTFDGSVKSAAYHGSGYLVGGDFSNYNDGSSSSDAPRIIALDASGVVSAGFDAGTGFDGTVHVVRYDAFTNKTYVGGEFTRYNGTDVPTLVRLNVDGSLDNGFTPSAP